MGQTQINRRWLLERRPSGLVRAHDFRRDDRPAPRADEGQFVVRNRYLAFEPAMRHWMSERPSYVDPVPLGAVMRSNCLGEVVESRHPDFCTGDLVEGWFGWQDYAVGPTIDQAVTKVDPGFAPTLSLSVLGLTGLTAYFGLLEVGRPREGETVVISGAAGATGSVAAQIAKLHGCRVIGIAGGAEKCAWLRTALQLDAVIDYRRDNLASELAKHCPDGIDLFFDNVGGSALEAALTNLALGARIVLCGAISGYNSDAFDPGPRNYLQLTIRRARMEGFIVTDFAPRFAEARAQLAAWVKVGKIRHREDIQQGFDRAPETMLRLFDGSNRGKQLLRIDED